MIRNSQGLGVNLPVLLRFYAHLEGYQEGDLRDRKLYEKLYKRLWRLVKSWEREGLATTAKVDGLLWVRPKPMLVDLMVKEWTLEKLKPASPASAPVRGHRCRVEAAEYLMKARGLSEEDWEALDELLQEYCEDSAERVIVLARREADEVKFAFLRYQHRFTKTKLKESLKLYDRLWDEAKYDVGVFITLTMDPKTYGNLYEACKRISTAFNRFMAFLAKRLGFRPCYISVLEPQDSGNPHLHVVVFGARRIGGHYELTKVLKAQGFGEIHFEYQIKKVNGKWVWANPEKRPKGASNVKDYLKKYLEKVFEPGLGASSTGPGKPLRKLAFYFASNKRFFTYSRSLRPARRRAEPRAGWRFVGSWRWLLIPNWILEAAGVTIVPDERLGWRVEKPPPPLAARLSWSWLD